MWKPKSQEFETLAKQIASEYQLPPKGQGLSVPEIARIYKLSTPSVYRYLQYKKIPIRPRLRNERGKFIASR